ncbi:MAG: hypothetical protein IJ514_06145 [Clostridia bacterium]|nr:hypothetical protein [Clostridia bacterium]
MTKFDGYMEGLERRRQRAREREADEALLWSLATRTKEEVVREMTENLTFIVGAATIVETERVKTPVF